ncbi:MAG: hypothetical protein AAF593_15720, partial [Planctomycetota bacterium]
MPSRSSDLAAWAKDFSALVVADPPAYGLTADQGTAVGDAVAAFVAAYETAANRETRTPVNIEAKNTAKRAMIEAIRRAVKVIQAWPEMTDAKR